MPIAAALSRVPVDLDTCTNLPLLASHSRADAIHNFEPERWKTDAIKNCTKLASYALFAVKM
jgi:hypothetical protein